MPPLKFKSPDGKIITVDSPDGSTPSEQELDQLFELAGNNQSTTTEPKVFGVAGSVPKSEYEAGKRNIFGNIGERPGAAIRGGILSVTKREDFVKGFEKGMGKPHEIPTFRSLAEQKSQRDVVERASRRTGILSPTRLPGRLLTETEAALGGTTAAVAGEIGDFMTEPINLIGLLAGRIKGVAELGKSILKTKPVQEFGRFLTKSRGVAGAGKLQEINQAFKNVKNPTGFAKEVRSNLFTKKKQIGDAFEEGVKSLSEANPGKTIDLSAQMQYIKNASDDVVNNPGLKSEISSIVRRVKNPEKAALLDDFIKNPEKASNLTLQQAQDIKTTIQQAPSIATKLKQGKFADWKASDLELLDLVDEIKLAQSELFPEMAQVREPYANYMAAYREVKNYFKPKSLLDRMKTGFGNEEIEQMVKVALPENTYKQIKGFRGLSKTKEAVKKGIVGGAVTGGVLYGLQQTGRKILGGK